MNHKTVQDSHFHTKQLKLSILNNSPTSAAIPLTKVNVPNPDVRSSKSHMSTITGEVTAHQADKKAPNITETIINAQYSSQKGMARGAIPPKPNK